MTERRHTSSEEIIAAVTEAKGIITRAAAALGINPNVIHERRKREEAVETAIAVAREQLVDLAEEAIFEMIGRKDFRAINLVLRTLGKDRGWVERVESVGITDEMLDRELERERAKLLPFPRLAVTEDVAHDWPDGEIPSDAGLT